MTLLNQLAVILSIKIQKCLIPIERTQASKTEVKSKFDHKRTRHDLLTSPSCHWNEHFQHNMRRRWKIKLAGKKLSAQLIHIKKNATSNESHL